VFVGVRYVGGGGGKKGGGGGGGVGVWGLHVMR